MRGPPPINEEVISRHAEDASFLWLRRDRAVHAFDYTLTDLERLDGRIDAHLDGLTTAGDEGWRLALEQLENGDPEDFFAAASVALLRADSSFEEVVAAAEAADLPATRGLISALAWSGEPAAKRLDVLAASRSEKARMVAIAARACLRTCEGAALERALRDPSPLVRARALRAVGEVGRKDLLLPLRQSNAETSPECRFWAAWSASILGNPTAIPVMLAASRTGKLHIERAIDLAVRASKGDSGAAIYRQLVSEGATCLALIAARALGDPANVPWILEAMEDETHARLAGDAFSTLVGVDLACEELVSEQPRREAGPTDDPADENVAMDRYADLPWPAVPQIRSWWEKRRDRFKKGGVYLLGEPLSLEHLRRVLVEGSQPRRAAAALELALARPGAPLFEVRAPGRLQRVWAAEPRPERRAR